uniref:Reverse transcriptase domain-containing protein n=1 Tax=Tanacetum cinerariifolium TaxID=118510 RepID=A0A6L2JG62_TANCI|nr:hypothetical protein [Tanacetum cinerariifolium]
MALLLAHKRFSEIKQAFRKEQHQPEIIQELLRKLLNDLQILNRMLLEKGEHAAQISTLSWKCPLFDDDDDEYKSNEVIKSSVENLVLIPSESEGIFDDTCDVSFCDNSPPLDVLNNHFELFSDFNDDCTSSDDDSFEDIDYVETSPDSELVSFEEVQDDILRGKLLNINVLIAKIESLNDNDTSLSYSDNSLPKFETFIDHTEETTSGSTTTHADNSLPEYDSFLFKIEPDQSELTSVVIEDILREPYVHVPNVLPTHPTLMLDSDFIPSDDSLRFDLEVSSETRNKIFDPRIFFEVQSKRFLSRDTFSVSFICNLLCPDFLDFEDSRAHDFVYRPLELLSLACLHMGI